MRFVCLNKDCECHKPQPSAGWEQQWDVDWRDGRFDGSIDDLSVIKEHKTFIASEIVRAKEEARYEIEAFVKDEKDPEIILDFIRSRT